MPAAARVTERRPVSAASEIRTPSRPGYIRTSDNVDLFYRDWGIDMPIVFLAGWTLSSDMWAYQMEPLSRLGFRCIAYDRRGHGRSSDPGRGYDFDTLADDLAAVMNGLDLEGATVVAHSFASGEIVRYLTRYGTGRVKRLVLVSPASVPYLLKTSDNPNGLDAEVFRQVRETYRQDFPGWAEANSAPYFVPGTSRAIVDWTIRMMTQTSLQAAIELNRIQTSTDFRPELSRLSLPTLVIHGDRDASMPLELTGGPAAALIPEARLEIYENGPHGLYYTHKERLNRDLAAFAAGEERNL